MAYKKQYSKAEKQSFYNGKKVAFKEIAKKAGIVKTAPKKQQSNVIYVVKE